MDKSQQIIHENAKSKLIQQTIEALAKQQEMCNSLSLLLSFVNCELAGAIETDYFNMLAGTADILELMAGNLQVLYSGLNEF
jgi:hypothetical protein